MIFLFFKFRGHITGDDALREPFGDSRLARASLADQDRIVLGAPRQDLHHAADLLIATDDRIEFLFARQLGHIDRILLQRLIGLFRFLTLDAARAAHLREDFQDIIETYPGRFQKRLHPAAHYEDSQKQMLRRHETVSEFRHLLFRPDEHLRERRREIQLSERSRFRLREMIDFVEDAALDLFRIHLLLRENHRHDRICLEQQRVQKMRGIHLRIAPRQCDLLRIAHRLLTFGCEFVDVHI